MSRRRGPLGVPKDDRVGFEKLASLSEDETAKLLAAVGAVSPTLREDDFIERVVERGGGSTDVVDPICSAVLSASGARASWDVSVEEFAEGLAESDDLTLPADQRSLLRRRLEALFAIPSLLVTSKALELLMDHERTFHSARVFTDLRPVFLDDPSAPPAASVILHTLKLSCHTRRGIEDIFVVMDDDEIEDMIDALSRAQVKAGTAAEVARAARLPVLSRDEEEDQ